MVELDSMGRTREQADADSDLARELCNGILRILDGESAGIVFNLAGYLAVVAHREIYEVEDALEAFDQWAKYARSVLEKELRARMQ